MHKHKLAKWVYKNNKHYVKMDDEDKYLTEEIFNLLVVTALVFLLIGIPIGTLI